MIVQSSLVGGNPVVIFTLGIFVGLLLSWRSSLRVETDRPYLQQQDVLVMLDSNSTGDDESSSSSSKATRKRMGDGCRFVFLDVGSNIGVQVRKLFEGDKYPNALFVRKFITRFGSQEIRRKYVCAFGIEANPRHQTRLKTIENCYNNRLGWRTKFFVPSLVSNTDGKSVQFYEDSGDDSHNAASTAFANPNFKYSANRAINVTSMDLGSFIMNEIVGRDIPDGPGTPFVYMKLDIEGSEFLVLPDLIAKGALCHVDEIMAEYHHDFMQTLENQQRAKLVDELVNAFTKLDNAAFGCKRTKISDQDEESYRYDGQPLPDECL